MMPKHFGGYVYYELFRNYLEKDFYAFNQNG